MCGILAVLETDSCVGAAARHAGSADARLDRLAHRGPDGRGALLTGRAWLGHRRLAIVDPEGGRQPMTGAGGVAWIANGEIYNHDSLRARFCEGADASSGASDCAVIGPVWRALGDGAPAALDGQFAFVACDERGHWIAARDHAGICPLYRGVHADGSIWFASEMKALVDVCASVEIVPPCCAWVFEPGSGARLIEWRRPSWMDRTPVAPPDHGALRAALVGAVRKRFMADVPFGVLLSGGVDSSLVASIACRLAREEGLTGGEPIHSFSIGLRDADGGAPDLAHARTASAFLGTVHHEYTFSIDEAWGAIPTLVRHLESYQQVRTAVPTYLLAKAMRADGFKMALSGEGADEILGGYLYFHKAPSREAFHEETVRKFTRLHQYDVMRANKAPMARGVELRFPFLDPAFVDLAMGIDPAHRMPGGVHGARAIEKRVLREAFDDPREPWLPAEVLWRQKEQFSDGVGYGWVDAIRERALALLGGDSLASRSRRFARFDEPTTPEMLMMREIFEREFVEQMASGDSALATVGVGRSIACSTPEALAWDPAWAKSGGDISGRTMAGVHGVATGAGGAGAGVGHESGVGPAAVA